MVINNYLKKTLSYNKLSCEEEIKLIEKIKKGDENARELFINSNLRLSIKIAKRYHALSGYKKDLYDIIQNGNIGLIYAIKKYNPKLNFKFSTYAVYWIEQSIIKGLKDENLIKIPEEKRKQKNILKIIKEEHLKKNDYEPSEENIIKEYQTILGKSKTISEIDYIKQDYQFISLENQDEDEKNLLDTIAGTDNEQLNNNLDQKRKKKVKKYLSQLNEIEERIITYFFYDNKNYKQISQEMNLPVYKIKNIFELSIRKLRKKMMDNKERLEDYI
jgi:RNA polymerase sigma factor (sigma-70 family)